MIQINDCNDNQNIRNFADLFEPFIVKKIQKKHHTFFAYRCSDYQDIYHLAKCHNLDLSNISINLNLFEKYWSAIDIVYFFIDNLPKYSKTKEYFDELRKIQLGNKIVNDFQLYEVKLVNYTKNPTISVKTFDLINELKKINKELIFIKIVVKGDFFINILEESFFNTNYNIKTHYGRKGYYLIKK
jgi:hypothetical protein